MKVYDKAISLLKIRPHHSVELTKKLILRGFNRDEVQEVISKLTDAGLLDNVHYAQTYLDSLMRNKTFGFYMLKVKLMQRGIASQEAEALLKQKLSLETEKAIAHRLLEKSLETDKLKLSQKLSRKGFRSEVIRSSLQAV